MTVRTECKKFKLRDENLARKFKSCSLEGQGLVLDYLSTGKGTIPYEMITRYDFLDIFPEKGNFFLTHHFYSSLTESIITREE